jgi:hypothetical protein
VASESLIGIGASGYGTLFEVLAGGSYGDI